MFKPSKKLMTYVTCKVCGVSRRDAPILCYDYQCPFVTKQELERRTSDEEEKSPKKDKPKK